MFTAPAFRRDRLLTGLILCGCLVSIAVSDWTLRILLPDGMRLLLPVLGACVGMGLAWRLACKRGSRSNFVALGDMSMISPIAYVDNDTGSGSIVPPMFPMQDVSLERAIVELGHYSIFTSILISQMNSVADLSEDAAGSILSNLTGLDTRITALLAFIQQSGSNDRVVQVIKEIEAQMQGCRQQLDDFAARQHSDRQLGLQQREKIASDANAVLQVLGRVNVVARQTTMLSLNVSIEASRSTEESKGFAVIAAEIRKLATEVQELAKDMHTRVKALMQTVTVDLQEHADQREQMEQAAVGNITQTLTTLADNLVSLIAHQRDILLKVESESEAIARPIMDIMGGVQFQDIIRQQLGQLNRMAEMVDDHVKSVIAMLQDPQKSAIESALSQKLDGMFNSYVMASQREMHMSARGHSVTKDSSALIELF